MKPISIGKQIVSGFGFINHFFDPDSKIDHVVIVSHSCAIPELTNLLKANPLQLYILAKVFTFHFLKPKKSPWKNLSGEMGDNADRQPVYNHRASFRWMNKMWQKSHF